MEDIQFDFKFLGAGFEEGFYCVSQQAEAILDSLGLSMTKAVLTLESLPGSMTTKLEGGVTLERVAWVSSAENGLFTLTVIDRFWTRNPKSKWFQYWTEL